MLRVPFKLTSDKKRDKSHNYSSTSSNEVPQFNGGQSFKLDTFNAVNSEESTSKLNRRLDYQA